MSEQDELDLGEVEAMVIECIERKPLKAEIEQETSHPIEMISGDERIWVKTHNRQFVIEVTVTEQPYASAPFGSENPSDESLRNLIGSDHFSCSGGKK